MSTQLSDPTELTNRIRRLAEKFGGAAGLAREAGLPQTTVANYLSRGSEPSRPALVALARAGCVTVDWLAAGEWLSPSLERIIARVVHDVEEILAQDEIEDASPELRAEITVNTLRHALAENWYPDITGPAPEARKGRRGAPQDVRAKIVSIIRKHAA